MFSNLKTNNSNFYRRLALRVERVLETRVDRDDLDLGRLARATRVVRRAVVLLPERAALLRVVRRAVVLLAADFLPAVSLERVAVLRTLFLAFDFVELAFVDRFVVPPTIEMGTRCATLERGFLVADCLEIKRPVCALLYTDLFFIMKYILQIFDMYIIAP